MRAHTFEQYLTEERLAQLASESDSIIDLMEISDDLPENNEELNSLSFIQKVYAYRDFLRMTSSEDERSLL